MSNQHVLKIHPAPLADLLSGAKTAEVRRNDRGFQVGDTVRLMEVNPETGNWTGAADQVCTITHIQTGYGLPDDLCVLSYGKVGHDYKAHWMGFMDRTDWMQEKGQVPAKYLGQHRADILTDMLREAREALARVEAERDERLRWAGDYAHQRDIARSDLAEALTLIRDAKEGLRTGPSYGWEDRLAAQLGGFLARHAQAEQQEAPKRGKPDWSSHGYDQIFQTSDGNWFGARAGWNFKGHISGQWKGREVSLLRDDGGFLAYGEPNPDWESSLEQRPAQEAKGAQAGDELVAKAIYDSDRSVFMTKREYAELHPQTKDRLLKMARAALATQPADDRAREMGYRSAINALDDLDRYKMAMSPATAAPEATQQQLNDLNNFFNSVCEGGLHSVEKAGIQSLTELGALENCGFGKHRLTRFGTYLLEQPAVRGAEHE